MSRPLSQAGAGRLPDLPVDGRSAIAIGLATVVILFVAARASTAGFVILAVLGLVALAVAAHRWPWQALVVSSVITLADPIVVPRFLPSGMELGPIGASEPMLLAVSLVIAFDAIRSGRFIPALRDPVVWLGIAFVALAILSALLNAVPPITAGLGILMTVDALAVYVVARMVPVGERDVFSAAAIVVGAAALVAVFGIGQVLLDPNLLGFFSFEGRFGEGGRITSFIGNPNMVAVVLGLALPFALYGSTRLETDRMRWVARGALFLIVLGLLLTFSRGAWLAVLVGTVIGALLLDRRALLALGIVVALAYVTATYMPRGLAVGLGPDGAEAPPPVGFDILGSTGERFGNVGGESELRIRFIKEGLPIIEDHLLLGAGPGRYGGAAARVVDSGLYDEYGASLYGYRTVHNFWLHLLGESGVIGTAVFLTLILGLLIRFVRAAWASSGATFVVLAGTATMGLVAGLSSLTEMTFEGNMPVFIVWALFGLASQLAPVRPLWVGRDAGST
jgi:O-antigen ligase